MNDEPKTPLETVGDGPLEARIVAAVLGEASAFESAEVERICRENPESDLFRQRIRKLHGLLEENAKPVSAEGWQLSEEKRRSLETLFAVEKTKPATKKRVTRKIAILSVMAACGLIAFTVIEWRPWTYEAVATIEVRPRIPVSVLGPGMSEISGGRQRTEHFFGTEFEKIKTRSSLENVVENLDLETRWNTDKETAFRKLDKIVDASRSKDTDLIDIKVRLSNRDEANEIANEVVKEYAAYRAGIEERDREHALAGLKKAIRDQEDKVEERRKVLNTIVRTRGIVYGGDSPVSDDRLAKLEVTKEDKRDSAILRGLDTHDYMEAKRDFETDQALLQTMKIKLMGEETTESLPFDSVIVHTPAGSGFDVKTLAESPTIVASAATPRPAEPRQELSLTKPLLPELAGEPESLASGYQSGDHAISRNNIDAILNDPQRAGGRADMEKQKPLSSSASAIASRAVSPEEIPVSAAKPAAPAQGFGEGTRAELLMDVDAAWGLEIPEDSSAFGPASETGEKSTESPAFDFSADILASENPYSTFSLHISDASFRLAKAALEKGERPDPALIKVEQFYNAVDYGDPAPSGSEPVASFIEQSLHPVIPNRQLVRVAVKTAAAGRSAEQPLRLTLLVDASGSMSREDRREAMETAMEKLVGLLGPADRVNLIGFARTPRLLAQELPGDQAKKLPGMIHTAANEGGTNLEEAIRLASELALRGKTPGAQNRIVLFTDGAANLGDADPARLAEKVKMLRQQGISFDVAGVGANELNDALLAELARHGDGRYRVISGGESGTEFARQLAGAFRPAAENVKVQVRFNPERVASYRLIGFEEHRLEQEDFRNDAVDAAELAAEEAGVAIYQVEVLPEGSGEIGELGVRFRDAAVGEMVERSWTIPHQAETPAFDQATPSMQLAGLSMLAAEKLKGGPLADAVSFEEFAKVSTGVKRYYGKSVKVDEMLEVIGKLR